MKKELLKIGVLFGGKSVEHDVSIISALQVMAVLKNKYQVYPLYLSRQNVLYYSQSFFDIKTFQTLDERKLQPYFVIKKPDGVFISKGVKKSRNNVKIDLILPIIHGQGTEDGTISSYLSFNEFVHPLPDITSSSILQDKDFSKILLKAANINVLDSITVYEKDYIKKGLSDSDLTYPLIVKPAHLGSSIGISIVNDYQQLKKALDLAFTLDDKVIIEKKLNNFSEFSCAIYQKKQEYQLSSIEEIKTADFFDFQAKYEHNEKVDCNTHLIPAVISTSLEEQIKTITQKVYCLFNLTSIVRMDFLYDLDTSTLYLNEVNTVPGSLSFYLFKDQGISFEQLLDDVIRQSYYMADFQKTKQTTFKSSILNKRFKLTK